MASHLREVERKPNDRSGDPPSDRQSMVLESPAEPSGGDVADRASEARGPNADLRARIDGLQNAVNAASGQVRNVYLTFLLFGLYLAIIFGSTTHEQLLRESSITLPLLNVGLPLVGFYWVAPALFVLLHFNLLVQCYLLAGKLRRLNDAILRLGEVKAQTVERARLDVFPLSQMLLGDHSNPLARRLPAIMAWTTIVIAPLVLLLFGQASFLPYHDAATTWWHRVLVMLDLGLVWLLWPRVIDAGEVLTQRLPATWLGLRVELLPLYAPIQEALDLAPWNDANHAVSLCRSKQAPLERVSIQAARFGLCAVVLTSLLAFSIPGTSLSFLVDGITKNAEHGRLFVFPRNLELREAQLFLSRSDTDLRAKGGEGTIADHTGGLGLRGRDLRYSDLSVADLRKADLRDASLEGAILTGALLQGATLWHTNLRAARLTRDPLLSTRADLQGADLRHADLGGADLQDANLQAVNFTGAQLTDANLRGADLQHAILDGANFTNVDLWHADLQGTSELGKANFAGATLPGDLSGRDLMGTDLQRANLKGVNLQGTRLQDANLRDANLEDANLQDGYLSGANLQHANLVGANLKDAHLSGANLHVANLTKANLETADLSSSCEFSLEECTDLHGADLTRANLRGANLVRVNFQGAHLSGATLSGANLEHTNLQEADLSCLRVSRSRRGPLLVCANFRGAKLTGADLQDATLFGASLQGADLRRADLRGADLSGAELQGADLSGANLLYALLDDGTNLRDRWFLADLRGVEISPYEPGFTKRIQEMAGVVEDVRVARRNDSRPEVPRFPKAWKSAPRVMFEPADPLPQRLAWGPRVWATDDAYENDLAWFLGELACGKDSTVHVAEGLARRAHEEGPAPQLFDTDVRLYAKLLAARLTGDDCPPAADLPGDMRKQLQELAGRRSSRGQLR